MWIDFPAYLIKKYATGLNIQVMMKGIRMPTLEPFNDLLISNAD